MQYEPLEYIKCEEGHDVKVDHIITDMDTILYDFAFWHECLECGDETFVKHEYPFAYIDEKKGICAVYAPYGYLQMHYHEIKYDFQDYDIKMFYDYKDLKDYVICLKYGYDHNIIMYYKYDVYELFGSRIHFDLDTDTGKLELSKEEVTPELINEITQRVKEYPEITIDVLNVETLETIFGNKNPKGTVKLMYSSDHNGMWYLSRIPAFIRNPEELIGKEVLLYKDYYEESGVYRAIAEEIYEFELEELFLPYERISYVLGVNPKDDEEVTNREPNLEEYDKFILTGKYDPFVNVMYKPVCSLIDIDDDLFMEVLSGKRLYKEHIVVSLFEYIIRFVKLSSDIRGSVCRRDDGTYVVLETLQLFNDLLEYHINLEDYMLYELENLEDRYKDYFNDRLYNELLDFYDSPNPYSKPTNRISTGVLRKLKIWLASKFLCEE